MKRSGPGNGLAWIVVVVGELVYRHVGRGLGLRGCDLVFTVSG